MSKLEFSGGTVSDAATRPDPPNANDQGLVVRPIGGGPSGEIIVIPIPSTDSGLVAIPATLVPVLLLAANADRIGFTIRNTSDTDWLYVKASTTVGAVSPVFHTVAIPPHGYYEDPYRYVGDVDGVWDPGATGLAMVDEYLP